MMNRVNPRTRRLRRNIPIMLVSYFLAGLRLFYPVTVLMYEAVAGSYTAAMTVFTVSSLSSAFFEIPTGVLSDKWGRKPVFILGCLCEFLSVVCYALAFSSSYGFLWLLMGGLIFGLSMALFSGNDNALIYETLSAYRRTRDMPKIRGRISAVEQASLAIVSLLAVLAFLADMSFQSLCLLTLIPFGINLALSFFLVEPPHLKHSQTDGAFLHMIKAGKLIAKNPTLRWIAVANALRYGMGTASHYFLPGFIAAVWPLWAVPFYRFGQNAIGAIGFWFAGPLVQKWGKMRALWSASLLGSLTSLAAYALSNIYSPVLLMGSQAAYTVSQTADTSLQQDLFTDAQRSTMGSLISFLAAILTGIASILTGVLADVFNPGAALLILLVVKIIPINIIYARLYKRNGA